MNKKNVEIGKAPSKIREIFEYGKKRKKEIGEDNVYDFSIGVPSAPVPDEVSETLIELIKNGNENNVHAYTSSMGDPDVRDAIADNLNKTYGCSLEGRLIYLTCGAAAALSISFDALLTPGDEAIIFAPYFIDYKVFIENMNATPIFVKPNPTDFTPDLDDFENKITNKTAFVLINSPCNPTGVILKEDTIIKISEILKRKEKEYGHTIYLVSDEPYRELIFEDLRYPFITNYYDDSLVCYSFSKSLSLSGERIGYIAINPKAKDAEDLYYAVCGAGRIKGYICAPSMFQFLLPHVLGETTDIEIYKRNRDLLYNSLKEMGYELVYPHGAFYLFMKALEEDDEKFSLVAREFNLLLVPSTPFGYPGYVRISYCVKEKVIRDSLRSFKKLIERYR